jgi:hypothetical protein
MTSTTGLLETNASQGASNEIHRVGLACSMSLAGCTRLPTESRAPVTGAEAIGQQEAPKGKAPDEVPSGGSQGTPRSTMQPVPTRQTREGEHNKEHRPEDDFCDSARNNKAHVPGEVGRHDADIK